MNSDFSGQTQVEKVQLEHSFGRGNGEEKESTILFRKKRKKGEWLPGLSWGAAFSFWGKKRGGEKKTVRPT